MAYSPDGSHAITASDDNTARVWNLATGQTTTILEGHTGSVLGVAYSPDGSHAITAAANGVARIWLLSQVETRAEGELYTNAKVLVVGESQAGKSGIAKVLAGEAWAPTESTIGAWATQLLVPTPGDGVVEREIWLWDFGGQADQRLIHQLYLGDAALAVLVFDGQRDDVIARLWDWDRAIKSANKPIPKLLAAGRIDINPVRLNRRDLDRFCEEAGFGSYVETSARTGAGCDLLRAAIVDAIDWQQLPWRSSPAVFRRIKSAVIDLKDNGRILTTTKELLDWLPGEIGHFTAAELDAALGLLAGPGAIARPGFGDHVLLQPELINAYGQAVIRTLRDDPAERGCVTEQRVLDGDLDYPEGFERLDGTDEAIVLRSLQRELVDRAICIRDHDPSGHRATLLVFPSYFRRERPDRPQEPAVFTIYRFDGYLDEIYSTLVVRLHHTDRFESSELWRNAADFLSASGHDLGIRLRPQTDGTGELDLFGDADLPSNERLVLTRFVHDHLVATAKEVERFRIYVCGHCNRSAGDRTVVTERLREGHQDIVCQGCESRIPLWDKIEEEFGSPELRAIVDQERERSRAVIRRESQLRAMVGDVVATAGRANQLPREVSGGFDIEIVLTSDDGRQTAEKLFVHLSAAPLPDTKLVHIPDPSWVDIDDPVMFVVSDDTGKLWWMEVGEALRNERESGRSWPVRTLPFDGEPLDILSVRRWRDHALGLASPQARKHVAAKVPIRSAPAGDVSTHATRANPPTESDEPASSSGSAWTQSWALIVAAGVIMTLIGFGLTIGLALVDRNDPPPASPLISDSTTTTPSATSSPPTSSTTTTTTNTTSAGSILTAVVSTQLFICDGERHVIGSLFDAMPGEQINFTSTGVDQIEPATANGGGTADLSWTCEPSDAGRTWEVTARGDTSDRTATFHVVSRR